MTRDELIKYYNNFLKFERLTNQEAIVGAGGAMLMLGLRTSTEDIDMDVPEMVFHRIVIKHGLETKKISTSCSNMLAKYDPVIDLHKSSGVPTMLVEGVRVWKPSFILQFKEKLNRDKDQEDIQKLKTYLNIK